MLKEVIDLQNKAVTSLVRLVRMKREVTFKAPTGSGKTYMMADLMDRILRDEKDVVFIVSSLSKGDLAEQNFEKFQEYQSIGKFKNLNPFLINSDFSGEESPFIPTDYNVYVLPRDLYKKGAILKDSGVMGEFLFTMRDSVFGKGKRIYVIKDECHIATKNLDELAANNFERVLNVSATPNLRRRQQPDFEIGDEEAVRTKLIKRVEFVEEETDIAVAIQKFVEVKKLYSIFPKVSPCLIIQISNQNKAEEELEKIFKVLNQPAYQHLKWMSIMQKTKKGKTDYSGCDTNDEIKKKGLPESRWRDYVKPDNSSIDIIIFKMVISEGWDIPRACMLYQMRDSQSQQLNEQVVGRVRRNPCLTYFEKLSPEAKDLAMQAWVWGIKPKENKSRTVRLYDVPTDITDNIKVKTTRLKTLTEKKDFSIREYMEKLPDREGYSDIFSLYRKYVNADCEIRVMCDMYADGAKGWFKFTENIEKITKDSSSYICNYEDSMILVTEEDNEEKPKFTSFPVESSYTDHNLSDRYESIDDWVWRRKGTNSTKFSFDSEAEKKWASILSKLSTSMNSNKDSVTQGVDTGVNNPNAGRRNLDGTIEPKKINPETKYLWGKNFLSNSEIKFEYCLNSKHSSYPDFVLKDSFGNIHLFEVKSINVSGSQSIDSEEYKDKIAALEKCYVQASKLTGHLFYLPVMNGDEWDIKKIANGNVRRITFEMFKKEIKEGKID